MVHTRRKGRPKSYRTHRIPVGEFLLTRWDVGAFLYLIADAHPVTIRRWRLRYGAAFPSAPCTKSGVRNFVASHKKRMRLDMLRRMEIGQRLTGPLKAHPGLTRARKSDTIPQASKQEEH